MNADGDQRKFGLQRGKVFPAKEAGSLLNPLRKLVQSPFVKAMEGGATGLLTKPIDFTLLRGEIDTRLAQAN